MELAVEFMVTEEMREEWLDELEALFPEKLDQTADDAELLVQYRYVPRSARLTGPIAGREDELTPCWMECTYQVVQYQAVEDRLATPIQLAGQVEIPVGWDGHLVTEEVDFITGLLGD